MATGTPSLAARCTTCQTVFRVVPDQLRVSSGWVRCGRCTAVFNAAENLVELEDGVVRRSVRLPVQVPAPVPVQATTTPQPDIDISSRPQPLAPLSKHPPTDVVATSDGAVVTDWSETRPYDDEAAIVVPDEAPVALPKPAAQPVAEAVEPVEPVDAAQAILPPVETEPPPTASAPLNSPARTLDAEPDDTPRRAPSFIRQADRAERWRQPRVRWAMAGASLLLAGALVMQVLVEYRDLAAARWPALRPLLVAACSIGGCRVDAARAIEGLAVESSGLVRIERSDRYRLALTLRNRAGIDLAVPALDLSLTDAQGRLLARRVLQLSELGTLQATVAAGRELSLQATLRAAPGTAGESVAGYTIELFYP